MKVNIRNVTIKDLGPVTKVEASCFPKAEAATNDSLKKRIKTFPECFFIAEVEGEIIGFINGCRINGTTIYDDLFIDTSLHIADGAYQTIFGLDVIAEYRKQGIAGKLLGQMITAAKKDGCKGVILTCKEKLIKYYTKFGFINRGISESEHGGATWYDMILEF